MSDAAAQAPVRQFLRKVSLVVANASGQGLEFADFKLTFAVRRGDTQTPNSCDVRVFNLSDNTVSRLQQKQGNSYEFAQIALQAGYEGNFGLIFKGNVKQIRTGRLNATDSYIDITGADGDESYNFSRMALSLAANLTAPPDQLRSIQDLLAGQAYGTVDPGYSPVLSTNALPRGRVFYGLTRDELRDFAQQNQVLWSIQDGKLTLIPAKGYIAGTTVPVISPATGLIGVPEQTQRGLKLRTLLNPFLRIGQCIRLVSRDINKYRYGLDYPSWPINDQMSRSQLKLNADGLYYVMIADHSGDTRGQEWYTDLCCLAVDAEPPPPSQVGAVVFPDVQSIRP